MNNRLQKWITWLKIIENEVTHLLVKKDIFWAINDIIKNNKNIQKPSSFYDYLNDTYIAYSVMGVRRQVKISNTSISLARLLCEIIETPQIISRDYYTNLYKGSPVECFANRDFDRYAGKGGRYICEDMVKSDYKTLVQSAIKCEELADKRFAHTDKRKIKTTIIYKDLDDSIDTLDKLCIKYNGVFHAASMSTLMPTYQYDWKEIFYYPWLIKEKVEINE